MSVSPCHPTERVLRRYCCCSISFANTRYTVMRLGGSLSPTSCALAATRTATCARLTRRPPRFPARYVWMMYSTHSSSIRRTPTSERTRRTTPDPPDSSHTLIKYCTFRTLIPKQKIIWYSTTERYWAVTQMQVEGDRSPASSLHPFLLQLRS
jgi:hypothetical protein